MKLRSMPLLIATTLTLAIGGGAGAATMHRFDISQTSGSAGAVTILQSTSSGGAIQGQVGSTPDTKQTIPFGVYGAYSGTQFGMGVVGISQTGYGVAAESFSSIQPGLLALDKGGGDALDTTVETGVDAALSVAGKQNNGGVGVAGYANSGIGGSFDAQPSGTGVEAAGFTGGTFIGLHGDALDGSSDDGEYGILGSTSGCFYKCTGGMGALGGGGGEGIIAFGRSGNTIAAIVANDTVGGSDLIASYAYNGGTPSESFIVQSNTANASGHSTGVGKASDVQISGDVYVSGNVYQTCNTFPETSSADCGSTAASSVRSTDGKTVRMYTPRESSPLVEDVGIAHVAGGHAHVVIDPAFARTMSHGRPYHVFLTPDGPSRGVYSIGRTAKGFDIAENAGGTSTVDVEYRVLATPFADGASRLAELPPVHKTPLASESETARSLSRAKATEAQVLARGRSMQTFSAERHARMAQAERTLFGSR